MQKIRILMVDDHSLFQESLGRLLESNPDFSVVAQAATISDALQMFTTTNPDVVLLDFDLGEEQGSRFLHELNLRQTKARVLMVTAGLSDDVTEQMMEAGAAGIFLKHSKLDQLVAAIHRVAEGGVWLDAGLIRSLFSGRANRPQAQESTKPLTTRQSEVLRAILDGLSNKEIAWQQNSSESAVKAVIQELFHKAGVRTRSQLVRIAIEKHSSDWL